MSSHSQRVEERKRAKERKRTIFMHAVEKTNTLWAKNAEEVATFFDEEDGSFGRVAQDRPEKNFAIRLQRQRYPPFLLLTDIIDTAVVSSNRKLNRE